MAGDTATFLAEGLLWFLTAMAVLVVLLGLFLPPEQGACPSLVSGVVGSRPAGCGQEAHEALLALAWGAGCTVAFGGGALLVHRHRRRRVARARVDRPSSATLPPPPVAPEGAAVGWREPGMPAGFWALPALVGGAVALSLGAASGLLAVSPLFGVYLGVGAGTAWLVRRPGAHSAYAVALDRGQLHWRMPRGRDQVPVSALVVAELRPQQGLSVVPDAWGRSQLRLVLRDGRSIDLFLADRRRRDGALSFVAHLQREAPHVRFEDQTGPAVSDGPLAGGPR